MINRQQKLFSTHEELKKIIDVTNEQKSTNHKRNKKLQQENICRNCRLCDMLALYVVAV